MAYKCKFAQAAELDLDETLNYIVNVLHNTAAATRLYGKLEEELANACIFPRSNPDCSVYCIINENIRHIRVEIIFASE